MRVRGAGAMVGGRLWSGLVEVGWFSFGRWGSCAGVRDVLW
jgi:hypothetical protein